MFTASENFDIADLKRSSVKMKGALQAEWQEVSRPGQGTNGLDTANLDLAALELIDDQDRAFLPRIDLTLKLTGNFKNSSYVPSNSVNQNFQNSHYSPAVISQLTC
jgi:hypothetical protein